MQNAKGAGFCFDGKPLVNLAQLDVTNFLLRLRQHFGSQYGRSRPMVIPFEGAKALPWSMAKLSKTPYGRCTTHVTKGSNDYRIGNSGDVKWCF